MRKAKEIKIRTRLHDVRRERDNLYSEEISYKDFICNSFAAITKKNNILQLNSTAFQAEYASLDTMQKRVMVIHNANNKHRETINNAPEKNNEDGAKSAIVSIKNSMVELRTLNVNAGSKITIINGLLTAAETEKAAAAAALAAQKVAEAKAIEAQRIEDAITARVQVEVERVLAEARAAESRAEEDDTVLTAEELLLMLANNATDSRTLELIASHSNASEAVYAKVLNNPCVTANPEIQSRIAAARAEAAQTSTANTTTPQYYNDSIALTNTYEATADAEDNNSPETKVGLTPQNSF